MKEWKEEDEEVGREVEYKTLIPLFNFKLLCFRAGNDKTYTVNHSTCH